MQTTVEKVTPAMAQKYLEMNTSNRPVRQGHVDFLAKEIKDGKWALNGATIVFNGGTLVDGQHRLLAVIKAARRYSPPLQRAQTKTASPQSTQAGREQREMFFRLSEN